MFYIKNSFIKLNFFPYTIIITIFLFLNKMEPVKGELTSISFIFETYSPYGLIRLFEFSDKNYNISIKCLQDMYTYLEGLRDGNLWAVKLYDANSFYGGGQYGGNIYRIHNPHTCRQLQNNHLNSLASHWDLSTNVSHQNSTVPFPVQLVLAKYEIEFIGESEKYHNIKQMICFPRTCNQSDLNQILSAVLVVPDSILLSMSFIEARLIPGDYQFTQDVTFYVLTIFIFTIFLIFLTISLCNYWVEKESYSTIKRLKTVLKATPVINNGKIKSFKHNGLEKAMEQFKKLSDYDICLSKNLKQIPFSDTRMTFNNINCKEYVNLVKVKKINERNSSKITLDIITETGEIEKPIKSSSTDRENLLNELLQCFSFKKIIAELSIHNFVEEDLRVISSLQSFCTIAIIFINTQNHLEIISNNFDPEQYSISLHIISFVRDQTAFFIDMFFFLSGASLSYLYYKTSKKNNSPNTFAQLIHFIGIIVYKICSIILTYTIILICLELSTKYFHESTILEIPSNDFLTCDLHKWKNVLFIDTFFPLEERCMVWSWLISLEIQFFLGGSLILLLAQIHPKYAASIFFAVLIFLIIAFFMLQLDPFTKFFEEETQKTVMLKLNLMSDKVWLNILPHLFGMCLGYVIQKIGRKFETTYTTIIIGWIFCVLIVAAYFFGIPFIISGVNKWVRGTAITISNLTWNIIISWIILSNLSDHSGFPGYLLNSQFLFTLGKLTNTAILLNPLIIRSVLLSGESVILISSGQVIMFFIGFTVATYLCALILHTFCEAPLLSALRILYQWQF